MTGATDADPNRLAGCADAVERMSLTLSHAETAFGFLAELHSTGDFQEARHRVAFEALCYLCRNGVAQSQDRDGDKVEHLVEALRRFKL